jgi:RimJ/RimL family protein N-acetyltransferase
MTALRPFTEDDLRLVAEWAGATDLGTYVSRLRPRGAGAVCHDPDCGLFWYVIVDGGADVGTVWLESGDRADEAILGIYLKDPSMFGRGIGSAAVRLALNERLVSRPLRAVDLHVRRNNARAIACHEKLGFAITARGTKVDAAGARVPFLEMRLALTPGPSSDALG